MEIINTVKCFYAYNYADKYLIITTEWLHMQFYTYPSTLQMVTFLLFSTRPPYVM